ncbi:acetyl xylan esterase [Wenjunlia vitaminophila]|uniref:Acetyl xylan esterase n=1 Tax=Wenjunlia vitaminophila TaxID=76728 RepID=A0A0T6LXW6_WENVI|nr:acetylxylan esterase [Wenjunlia vitaminophila]KRV50872.1 acetyl xylan esterase [Wenjunlia vitaminophila]
MPRFTHDFPFDPSHGHTLDDLLRVPAPEAPADFDAFWRARYSAARRIAPEPRTGALVEERDGARVLEVSYASVYGRRGGWLVLPAHGAPARHGFVIGHGYGGRDQPGPDLPLPLPRSAALLPCVSGMPTRGLRDGVPPLARDHVLHGIDSRDGYVIGDCVTDLWCAASALLELVPELTAGRLGYLGESFGGGLGALALPWDDRFAAAQLTVPTFGNHPLRLTLPCTGSGEAVRRHHRDHPGITEVLAYYDAATAATRITVPVLVAPALFDPVVPPPGQFAVHGALAGPRELHVLDAGHFEHEGTKEAQEALRAAGADFFSRALG